ncbi:MAG TPA: hypothetical protein VEV83_00755 [Parafilimonas sp.]|nr:hypothetical protein [Parafilimonas sp.]
MYDYDARFYTCTNSSQLYCNYRIDDNSYSIEGNTTAVSPELYTNVTSTTDTRFNLSDNNMGVRFNVWFAFDNYANIYPGDITVNGVEVEMDISPGQSEIYLYRNDVTVGGIREGWFNIYYKDTNGQKHDITGNFRVKIN